MGRRIRLGCVSIQIYGIRHCDTMKKAFAWLDSHGLEYRFHDYKKAGVPIETANGLPHAATRNELYWTTLGVPSHTATQEHDHEPLGGNHDRYTAYR